MAQIGYATIGILPSLKGFGSKLSQGIDPEMTKAGTSGGKRLGSGMLAGAKSFVGPIAALFAAKIGVDFFKSAIGGASDLNESTSKVGVVFGKYSAQILAGSKTSATAMGLSQNAYLGATGTLGNLLVSLGIAPKASAGLSTSMVKLAGDMASFNNTSPADALEALRSGLTGETEPLRRYGVNMNDATLKAQALKMGLIKTTKEALTPQAKALAAQALIMAQTGTAQGDFARTSGGLANQQRILSAQFEDVKTKIGGALLPAVTTVTTAFNGFVTQIQNGTGAGGAFVGLLQGIWAAIQPIGTFIMGTVVPAVQSLFTSFQTGGGPAAITGAFSGLVAFFQTQVVPAVMAIVTAIQGFVSVALPIVQAFVAGMMARIQPMLPTITAIFATIGQNITLALELIRAVIERVTTVIKYVWETWGGSIMSFITGVWSKMLVIIQAALNIIQGVIKTVTSIIKGDWSGAWDGIKMILSGVWDAIKGIISAALNIIGGILSAAWALIKLGVSAAWDAITGAISSAWDGIKTAVSTKAGELVTFVEGIPGKIKTALGDLATLLTQKGKDVIQGLWDGMLFVWNKVTSWISGIATWIKDHKGPLSLDAKLLTPHGSAIMQGFWDGLKSGFSQVQSGVSGMAGQISSGVSQWLPIVNQALSMLGQPLSLAPIVLSRMNQESGGNAAAINNWDSNAQNGDPSRGLMQTIGSTFSAYKLPGLSSNIYDPLSNIVASMRYALDRYGSLSSAYNRPGGYALGTSNAAPGYAWVGERGPELMKFRGGEQVVPNHALGAGSGSGNGATSDDIRALGDRIGAELDRQARTIQTMQRQMARA